MSQFENGHEIEKLSPQVKSLLALHNISAAYDDELILKNISFELNENEIIAILGPSGGGKSTLFHVIAGLLTPKSGNVILAGEEITGKTGHVSYMLQKDLLLPFKSVEDNIALPLRLRGLSKAESRDRVESELDRFGLAGYGKKYPSELSGGMRQRAALLRTYLFDSKLMLLDEPFSALDALTRKQMQNWFLELHSKLQLSAILVTHDVNEAIYLADRIYVLKSKPAQLSPPYFVHVPRSERSETNPACLELSQELFTELES